MFQLSKHYKEPQYIFRANARGFAFSFYRSTFHSWTAVNSGALLKLGTICSNQVI